MCICDVYVYVLISRFPNIKHTSLDVFFCAQLVVLNILDITPYKFIKDIPHSFLRLYIVFHCVDILCFIHSFIGL